MSGGQERLGQVRQIGRPSFQQFEPGGMQKPGAGNSEQLGKPEIHIGGTPIVTVRLVNGVQQDIPHLHIDSKGGQIRWWVERESIGSWQKRVRTAQESGDKRYEGVSLDRLPSSICHTYPNVPSDVLERQPEYKDREWITLSYSLTPTQEQERVALTPNQEGEVVVEKYTFLNTPASSEEEATSFRRSVKVPLWREISEEVELSDQAEPKPQARDNDEQ